MKIYELLMLGGKKEPLLSGHVNQSGGTFSFYVNKTAYNSEDGTLITVPVDSEGNFVWNNTEGITLTSMAAMFYQNDKLSEIKFGKSFNSRNVTNMDDVFDVCPSLTSIDVSNLDTSSCTSMIRMFRQTGISSLDLSMLDTSKVENFDSMFSGCSSLTSLNLSNWDTSNVTNMFNMFYGCSSLTTVGGLSSLNTDNVTTMQQMFNNCYALTTLDLSGWNTSNVTNMRNMFSGCSALTYLKLDNWTTIQTTSYSTFVPNVSTLTIDYRNVKWNPSIVSAFQRVNWNDLGYVMSGTVSSGDTLTFEINKTSYNSEGTAITVPVVNGKWSWSNEEGYDITSLTGAFYSASASSVLTSISFGTMLKEVGPIRTDYMLFYKTGLTTVNNLENISSTDCSYMFRDCTFTTVDVSNFDVSNSVSLNNMFSRCANLTTITGLENWNTSNVTNMYGVFYNCSALTAVNGISQWNTSNVTDMNRMFYSCNALTSLDLSGWDTSKVTNISNMFNYCGYITKLKLDNWDTRAVTTAANYANLVPNRRNLSIDYKHSKWNMAIPAIFTLVSWNDLEA